MDAEEEELVGVKVLLDLHDIWEKQARELWETDGQSGWISTNGCRNSFAFLDTISAMVELWYVPEWEPVDLGEEEQDERNHRKVFKQA